MSTDQSAFEGRMPVLRFSVELILWTSGLLAAAIGLMLAGIVLRRLQRRRYFRARDRARQQLQPLAEAILQGREYPLGRAFTDLEQDVLEIVLLARLEENPGQGAPLIRFFERNGFVDRQVARLRWRSAWARAQAALTLGRMRSPEGVIALLNALDDPHGDVRLAAVRSLTLLASPVAVQPLIHFLGRGAPDVPESALAPALAACCRASPALLVDVLATCSDNRARIIAAAALAEISTPMIRGLLQPYLFDAEPEVRARIATAIGRLRDWDAVNSLVGLMDDPVWFVRLRAVHALGEIGDWRALPALLKAVQDENWQVRSRAAQILGQQKWVVGSVIESVEHSGDCYALQGLLSELERAGLIWKAIGQLCVPESRVRADARAVVTSAIRAGALRAALHALETFPDPEVVLELAGLLRDHVRPADLVLLRALARSPALAPPVARLLEEAMAEEAGAGEGTEAKPVRS